MTMMTKKRRFSNNLIFLTILVIVCSSILLMGNGVYGQETATVDSSASATDDATATITEEETTTDTSSPTPEESEATDTAATTEDVEEAEGGGEEEVVDLDGGETTESATDETAATTTATEEAAAGTQQQEEVLDKSKQTGPLIDLFGPSLLSLEMIDEQTAQFKEHMTNDALKGKKVIGVYFSADWCGPCRQFTPELVSFYNKMNGRRGKKDQFEIIWVSRCRDVNSYAQYFTTMNWMALPPDEALGARGQMLGEKYKVKSIPTLVLLDDLGNVITTDARNKIPQDKAGIGFPWRDPFSAVISALFPRSLRLMLKSQIDIVKDKMLQKVKTMIGLGKKPVSA